jgi:hypothetical protein
MPHRGIVIAVKDSDARNFVSRETGDAMTDARELPFIVPLEGGGAVGVWRHSETGKVQAHELTETEFAALKEETIAKMAHELFDAWVEQGLADGSIERVEGKPGTFRNVKL